jgi:2,5-diketo-D-gluconate reductase A
MSDDEADEAVAHAASAGYRLFDTAENYRNERGVGRGLKRSGLAREEFSLTTKFNVEWHGADLRSLFEERVQLLGVEYVDLLMIHWPNPEHGRYVEAWRGVLALHEEGLVRALGVSNFKPAHIERLREETGVRPDVNQIQLTPYVSQRDVQAYHREHGIVTESWGPLGSGRSGLLEEPVIVSLAERHAKTPAQIVLRWHVELGLVPIPKASSVEHLRENIAIFDFALDPFEVEAISALDDGSASPIDADLFGH